MYKRILNLCSLAVILLLTVSACVKNEFTVDVSLPADVSRTYKTLYYASDPQKGWIVEGVISLEEGKAQINYITRNPVIVYIFAAGSTPLTFFYAERGDKIVITGKDNDPVSWQITGNKINDQLTQWRDANSKLLKNWNQQTHSGSEALNKAVSDYVIKNPDNPISTLLLLEYYDRSIDMEGFRKNWSKLKGEALEGKWRELVSRSDMITDPVEITLPKQWIIKNAVGGRDTLDFGKLPMLLHFSRSTDTQYRTNVDILKELAASSNDSTERIIANIQLEPDSLIRAQSARTDSLVKVIEGWVPLGVSDPEIKKMGVNSLPLIMVIGTNNKQVYRGDDMQQAQEAFKKLIKK